MICIIDYDGGNISALSNILVRLNVKFIISNNESDIFNSSKIILPGVSNFAYCINQIKKNNLDKILKHGVIEKKKPFLGICSGMQILSKFSEEENVNVLSFIDASVKKYIIDKLSINDDEFDNIINNKNKNFKNYITYYNFFKNFGFFVKILYKLNLIPKLLYLRYFGHKY